MMAVGSCFGGTILSSQLQLQVELVFPLFSVSLVVVTSN